MVRACSSWGADSSTICLSLSGIGTFSTIVRPRATRRCLTWSMTSDTSRTTWSPWSVTAPVSSPFSRRTRACWALVLTLTQMSAKASDATNSRTSRSISPLIAPESGPTSFCRRGRSVMTPANTSLRTASTSTCCSMALGTVVAMASCPCGEFTRGPTVSRYRCASFSVRCPQNATRAGVVSSTANTTQTTTAIDRPVARRSAVDGSMVWVDPASDIPGLLGPTSWGSHRADLRFRMHANLVGDAYSAGPRRPRPRPPRRACPGSGCAGWRWPPSARYPAAPPPARGGQKQKEQGREGQEDDAQQRPQEGAERGVDPLGPGDPHDEHRQPRKDPGEDREQTTHLTLQSWRHRSCCGGRRRRHLIASSHRGGIDPPPTSGSSVCDSWLRGGS